MDDDTLPASTDSTYGVAPGPLHDVRSNEPPGATLIVRIPSMVSGRPGRHTVGRIGRFHEVDRSLADRGRRTVRFDQERGLLIDGNGARHRAPAVLDDAGEEHEEAAEPIARHEVRVGDDAVHARQGEEPALQGDLRRIRVRQRLRRGHGVFQCREAELAKYRQARARAADRHAAARQRIQRRLHRRVLPEPDVVGLIPAGQEHGFRVFEAVEHVGIERRLAPVEHDRFD